MAEGSRSSNFWMVVRNTLLMAVVGFPIVLYIWPKQPEQRVQLYLGDPTTGCLFEYETLDLERLKIFAVEALPTHWDEFTDVKSAERIGYHPCTVEHPY